MKEEYISSIVEVRRVSDRIMSLKLETERVMFNVVSAYSLQVRCQLEDKRQL